MSIQRSSFFRWLVQISRFGLVGLFAFTAIAKLSVITTFASNVAELLSSTGINYARWMWPTTISVIAIEFLIVLLLLIPRTVRVGAAAASALLLAFAVYALYYVYVLSGEPLECGCFGEIIASQLGVNTALRNLMLLLPAVLVIFGNSRVGRSVALTPKSGPAGA